MYCVLHDLRRYQCNKVGSAGLQISGLTCDLYALRQYQCHQVGSAGVPELSFCMVFSCPQSATPQADSSNIPKKARPYVGLLITISRNASREAALTEQESAWDIFAKSPYAKGLRQFTPATGKWMARTHCKHLGSYQPYNANWSLRCGVIYSELLQKNNEYKGGYCFNRKVAEQEYNGGGWVVKELREAG